MESTNGAKNCRPLERSSFSPRLYLPAYSMEVPGGEVDTRR
jgi:hypothetical protein